MMMNLQLFAGSLTVTVYKDGGITTATASPASSLAEGDTVELTITPASGKELDKIIVLSGGVEIDMDELTFDMGEANVVLVVTSKANNLYKVLETTYYAVNGVEGTLLRNTVVEVNQNGSIVDVKCDGTPLTMGPAFQSLINSGVLVKI